MDKLTIAIIGAGRAMELHMAAFHRVYGVTIEIKTIVARREEQLLEVQARYGVQNITTDINEVLEDSQIDIIDICTPPYTHKDMIINALQHNKHVICEKPLTGYFGDQDDEETTVGDVVSKEDMFVEVMKSLNEIKNVVDESDRKFCYAENFVYAPAIQKAKELICEKRSRILYIKGEESLKGSSSKVAGLWNKTGGGSLIRVGIHPLSAILWLKNEEAKAQGETIKVVSVSADMSRVTTGLSEYEHRYIKARPVDVEDTSTVSLKFSDSSQAVVIATDTCLGGSKNEVEIYCNDANIKCQLTMNDLMQTYYLDEHGLDNCELSEMLPSKVGWNKPFIEDEIIRGYTKEAQDFVDAILENREPQSNFQTAYETIMIIYAAYKSAESGMRVNIDN